MGIQENAAKILQYLYLKRRENSGFEEAVEDSDLSEAEVSEAFEYLEDKDYIECQHTFGGIIFQKVTHKGIDVVEDEQEFKRSFNFGVNLGLIKAEWGVQEE